MLVALALGLAAGASACAHTKTPDTFVRMQRRGCLGWCQVYTLTLYADGAVQYQGFANVPKDTDWGTAASAEVVRLMETAERVPQWHCDWKRITTDLPGGATITVSRHGRVTQRIEPYPGDPCTPEAASELEVEIDVVGHASRFIDR